MSNMLFSAETKYLEEQLNVVKGSLDSASKNIFLMADDNGVWDETVKFVEGTNPDYIINNWPDTSLLESYLFHFIIIQDADGNDIYVEFYDYNNNEELPIPDGFTNIISPLTKEVLALYEDENNWPDTLEERGTGGIVFYNDVAYLLATMPVTNSRDTGTPVGTITVGNILSNEYFHQLSHFDTTNYEMVKTSDMSHVSDYVIDRDRHDVVFTSLPLTDICGNPVLLVMSGNRAIYSQGLTTINLAFGLLILSCLLFIVFLYIMLTRMILNPIEHLSQDITSISSDGLIDTKKYSKSKEFYSLGTSINKMLDGMNQSNVSLSVVTSILNSMDAYLYVSDPENDKILFMNDSMIEHYGLKGQIIGKTRKEILQEGIGKRCDLCPLEKLENNPTSVVVWEEQNSITGRYYRNTDRYIQWTERKMVHLQHAIDITDIKHAEESLKKRLEQQELMSTMSQNFISDEDMDILINNALKMTGEFMGVDKIVIAALGQDNDIIEYRYGWINNSDDTQELAVSAFPFKEGYVFYDAFIDKKLPHLSCSDTENTPEFVSFSEFGVKSILSTPIYVSDNFWGIINIDKCFENYIWSESDIALIEMIGSVISGVILRNETKEELIAAKELAEESNKAKSDFLSRMSHEMRTPMNAIIGMTNIALKSTDLEKKDYCLDKISDASAHLLNVINDVLDISKIEANKFELSYAEFDFEKMLMNVTNVINFRVDEKKQNLIINVSHEMPRYVISDEYRLSQVITNLLSNANKFTPEEGTILLTANKLEELDDKIILRVEVKDTGIGINKKDQKKLFRSFEQADGGISRKYGGTGLGLAISKSIVEMMDGRIWIESEEGKGSSFIFEVQVQKSDSSQRVMLPPEINWKNLKLLVIDDSPEVREYFLSLAEQINVHCEVAADGYEACELIEKNKEEKFNIIFVDWRMPGMDGIELTRKIKELYGKNTIVIMISATEWSDIEDEAKAAGVNSYIPKPLFPSKIVDCINHYIEFQHEVYVDDTEEQVDIIDCFKGKKILLVEDVEINREIVVSMLHDTAITIESAENGIIAYEKFKNNPDRYDLILMDIHMPEQDGYVTTQKIRELNMPEAKTTPIIAMTANVFKEDIDRCIAAGMNDHIGKPLNFEDVIQKLNKYL